MAIDPVALKAEIAADPESLLAPELVSNGATRMIAACMNKPRTNPDATLLDTDGLLTPEFNVKESITGGELLSCVDIDEFDDVNLRPAAKRMLEAAMQAQTIPVNKRLMKLIAQNFGVTSETRQALGALIYTPKSRAQLLFGGPVTEADVAAAMRA